MGLSRRHRTESQTQTVGLSHRHRSESLIQTQD
uniref:Uncharacterized protein n=1 Tax=Anguilla anguilla TaxID=7936 RepID=A0A0E9TKB8_ANGAN